MYFLKGKIGLKTDKFAVLEAGGVGFKVFLSEKTLSNLPEEGGAAKIFTFLRLKEKEAELYGFLTPKELAVFEALNAIPGIGPKTSLILASFGSLEELRKALEKPDQEFFKKIKGVGRKKLQKITLEITGKIKEAGKTRRGPDREALAALKSLGFSKEEATKALSSVPPAARNTEEKVREALKIMAKN